MKKYLLMLIICCTGIVSVTFANPLSNPYTSSSVCAEYMSDMQAKAPYSYYKYFRALSGDDGAWWSEDCSGGHCTLSEKSASLCDVLDGSGQSSLPITADFFSHFQQVVIPQMKAEVANANAKKPFDNKPACIHISCSYAEGGVASPNSCSVSYAQPTGMFGGCSS